MENLFLSCANGAQINKLIEDSGLNVYPFSVNSKGNSVFFMINCTQEDMLVVYGEDCANFDGEGAEADGTLCGSYFDYHTAGQSSRLTCFGTGHGCQGISWSGDQS